MTPDEKARAAHELQTLIIARDEEIDNMRFRLQRAVDGTVKMREEIAGCERQIRRQSETIREQSERMKEALSILTSREWPLRCELERIGSLLAQNTDKPAIKEESK